MWAALSTMRRLKTRLRRLTLTNMIIIVLTLTGILFITTLFSYNEHTLNENGRESINSNLHYRSIQLPRVRLPFPNILGGRDQPNDNQIDDPEHAGASSATTFRDGVLGNYEMKIETGLSRPGDNGIKFSVDTIDGIDHEKVESLKQEYGVNMVASDYIPMDRVVPDIRHPECKYWHYPEQLPSASIVIVFHNEGLTTLMRTVHSVLLKSSRKLIKEVLLLDDCSDKENLKKPLEDYIEEKFGTFSSKDMPSYSQEKGNQGEALFEKSGKVRLIRNVERQGLIRSRSRGAESATGDVVVFLDAHCEVNHNWLPPLLAPIANNKKTLTVPIIDGIDSVDFEYRPVYSNNEEHYRGIWEWGMLYKEISLNMSEHLKTHRVSEPYDSPTHAGGLFAINRAFFNELGLYDPGLLIWGGENFELSFKVWQCGGRLQWVPCSRVGHIYRPFMPYTFGSMASERKGPLVLTNYKRVVEVWFDDKYKEYFYTREPLARFYDAGNITKQLELKENLGCKSFDWFMLNVASDVFHDFPRLPPNLEWGEVRLKGTLKCLDTKGPQPPQQVVLSQCHSLGGNQLFRLNSAGRLSVGERCVDATRSKMSLIYCKLGRVDGPWRLDGHYIIHRLKNLCLTYKADVDRVLLDTCDFQADSPKQQRWTWKNIRPRVYDK